MKHDQQHTATYNSKTENKLRKENQPVKNFQIFIPIQCTQKITTSCNFTGYVAFLSSVQIHPTSTKFTSVTWKDSFSKKPTLQTIQRKSSSGLRVLNFTLVRAVLHHLKSFALLRPFIDPSNWD